MSLYPRALTAYSGPVCGPYDDPDWVAYCTDRERYTDDDYEDEEEAEYARNFFAEPYAVYDP